MHKQDFTTGQAVCDKTCQVLARCSEYLIPPFEISPFLDRGRITADMPSCCQIRNPHRRGFPLQNAPRLMRSPGCFDGINRTEALVVVWERNRVRLRFKAPVLRPRAGGWRAQGAGQPRHDTSEPRGSPRSELDFPGYHPVSFYELPRV